MTDLDRARKASELVSIMVKAFTELTNEYWHDSCCAPMHCRQLNLELEQAERSAGIDLAEAERLALEVLALEPPTL